MIIITAADWRFKAGAENLQLAAEAFGYRFQAYDLGGLGFGIPHVVNDKQFVQEGFYNYTTSVWKSKALHKPSVVSHALRDASELVVYLDADTILCDRIDEIVGDYSIGVTIRRPVEPCVNIGKVNAGVVFFNPVAADLVAEWEELTEECGNDQRALNRLHQKHPDRFREFPTDLYNWYYFGESQETAKILHFKDNKHEMGRYIDDSRRKRLI